MRAVIRGRRKLLGLEFERPSWQRHLFLHGGHHPGDRRGLAHLVDAHRRRNPYVRRGDGRVGLLLGRQFLRSAWRHIPL